jgi:hypothetical protein
MIRFTKIFLNKASYCLLINKAWILWSFSFIIVTVPAACEIKFSRTQDQALYEILDLHTITAQQIIDDNRKQDPENIHLEYLENWKEVVELIGYEDQDNYEVYVKSFDNRLKRINSWQNSESEAYLISLAEMYSHAGMVNVMYGDYITGFRKLLKANNLSKRNIKEYPEYWPNNKLRGVLNVSLDQMPTVLKWFTSLLGLSGDSEKGLKQINSYLSMVQDYPGLKSEALIYKIFIMKMKKDEEGAYHMLQYELKNSIPPTLLKYLQANVTYLASRNEEALSILNSFPENYTEVPFYLVDYLKGKSKMNKLDSDANEFMIRFLEGSNFKNYKREMYNLLSYYYYIYKDLEKYNYYKNQIQHCAKATSDRDREASIDAERPYLPHAELLKARFLLHGGYIKGGVVILNGISVSQLSLPVYRAEYYLLRAKVLQHENNFEGAKSYFDLAISYGKELAEHYAAEAALMAGNLAYNNGYMDMARNYWEMTFVINNKKNIYVENIRKKAKYNLKKINT